MNYIKTEIGDVSGRAFVDSAPIMEKAWASKSGLGWIGKNTNLISKKTGSFFFIAELIIDLELEYDSSTTDHCGSCTKCIDACPTEALIAPYQIDGSKCISYLTIELKDQIPNEFKDKMDNWAFGCDICQTVCPWNRFSKEHKEESFSPKEELIKMTKNEWNEITEDVFNTVFKNSAIKRAKYNGLKRNIKFLKIRHLTFFSMNEALNHNLKSSKTRIVHDEKQILKQNTIILSYRQFLKILKFKKHHYYCRLIKNQKN